MNGMDWIESTMTTAQTRLDIATANLANAHVKNFQPERFHAVLNASGIVIMPTSPPAPSAHQAVPLTDSTHEMVEVLQAQRNFETAQKTSMAIDAVRSKEAQEVGRAAQ